MEYFQYLIACVGICGYLIEATHVWKFPTLQMGTGDDFGLGWDTSWVGSNFNVRISVLLSF